MIFTRSLQLQKQKARATKITKVEVKVKWRMPLVNFTNILWAHLRQYCCAKKVQTLNLSTKSFAQKIRIKKPRLKCWWNWDLENHDFDEKKCLFFCSWKTNSINLSISSDLSCCEQLYYYVVFLEDVQKTKKVKQTTKKINWIHLQLLKLKLNKKNHSNKSPILPLPPFHWDSKEGLEHFNLMLRTSERYNPAKFLSITHTNTHTLCISLSRTHFHTHSLTQTHTLSLSLTHTHCLSFTHYTVSVSISLTNTHRLIHILSHKHKNL